MITTVGLAEGIIDDTCLVPTISLHDLFEVAVPKKR